eukprot:TRINITY_DN7943_c0_g1_i1.p1 TRINITY_DN7943_c0_g1~~TRINITY_DN7943_c0_g1_i1.p1  ORF type:complete len:405 (+),score=161.85 TRINITY_DN7943_c0_g1_i1:41-1216(+)
MKTNGTTSAASRVATIVLVLVALVAVASAQFRCPLGGVLYENDGGSRDNSYFFFSNYTNGVGLVIEPNNGREISALGTWTVVDVRDVTVDNGGTIAITQAIDLSIAFECRSSRNNNACLGASETLTLTIQFAPDCSNFEVTAYTTTCPTLEGLYDNFGRYVPDLTDRGCDIEGGWGAASRSSDFYFTGVQTLFSFDGSSTTDITFLSRYTFTSDGTLILQDVCGTTDLASNGALCSSNSEGAYVSTFANNCNGFSLQVEEDSCNDRRTFFDQSTFSRLVPSVDADPSPASPGTPGTPGTPNTSVQNEDTNSFSPLPTASDLQIPVIHLPSIFFGDTFSDGEFQTTYRGRQITTLFTSNLLRPALYYSPTSSAISLVPALFFFHLLVALLFV